MARLSASEVSDLIQEAWDKNWYDAVLGEQVYAYGGVQQTSGSAGMGWDQMPISPDVTSTYQEVGKVRLSLQAAYVAQSRIMSSEPEPGFEGLDEIEITVRQGYWRNRYHGLSGGQPWGQSGQDVWMDGRQHGVGAMQIGLETNRDTELQRTACQHVPILQMMWDPKARDPRRSEYVAAVKFLAPEVAFARYGRLHCERHVRTYPISGDSRMGRQVSVVPVIEFFSTWIGDREPTEAICIGNLSSKPMAVKSNSVGIPFAFMVHFLCPGMRKPIGVVAMQRSAEEQINDVIGYLKAVLAMAPGQTYVNTKALDPEQVEGWKNGQSYSVMEVTDEQLTSAPAWHVPGPEVDSSAVKLYELMTQEFGRQSGLSELDRGGSLQGDKTKFEVAQMQSAVAQNMGGTTFQTVRFLREWMVKVFQVGKMYDRDRFSLTLKGEAIELNVAGEFDSHISKWLSKEAPLVLAAEDLTSADDESKRMKRMAQLERLAPLVGRGIDPLQYVTEMLRTIGIQDVEKWLQKAAQNVAQQGADPAQVQQMMEGLSGGAGALQAAG